MTLAYQWSSLGELWLLGEEVLLGLGSVGSWASGKRDGTSSNHDTLDCTELSHVLPGLITLFQTNLLLPLGSSSLRPPPSSWTCWLLELLT